MALIIAAVALRCHRELPRALRRYATLVAGRVVSRDPDGTLLHFGALGWVAGGCTLLCVLIARGIQVVPDTLPQRAPEWTACVTCA